MPQKVNLSNHDVYQLLQKTHGKNLSLISYSIGTLGESPIGFLGNHFRLTVQHSIKENPSDEEIVKSSYFIKTKPSVIEHAAYVEGIGAFKKEVYLYKNVMPKLIDVTRFLKYPWSPNCHILKEDLLLFEDLSIKGYQLAEGREILDFEHCVAVMKTLADFHTASIICEEENKKMDPNKYKISDVYPEAINEVCYVFEEGLPRAKWFTSVVNACVHLTKLIGRQNDSSKVPEIIRKAVSDVGPSSTSRNVLSHGDLWSNNFMFNYEFDGSIKHCIIVDYQLARYAPVALDLMCCLHLIAPLKLRYFFMDHFVNTYYERFSDNLSRAGLESDEILPREQLDEGCRKYKITGIVEALLYGTTIWIPSKLSSEILHHPSRCLEITLGDRSSMIEQAYKEDRFFRDQMKSLMIELLDTAASPVIT